MAEKTTAEKVLDAIGQALEALRLAIPRDQTVNECMTLQLIRAACEYADGAPDQTEHEHCSVFTYRWRDSVLEVSQDKGTLDVSCLAYTQIATREVTK